MSDQPSPGGVGPGPLTLEQLQHRRMQAFLRAPVPRVYTNGFAINGSATDVSVVLLDGQNPTAIVTMTYAAAKTLTEGITSTLNNYEDKIGEKVKSLDELKLHFGQK